ncbi:hypothetical protein BT96DRAFT_978532 [Gymnopus androsaceus JB14]|uniref:Uncharacterized protein n=1 Tax=Gymnopus androsaceus JB14 TaxID=1447944 RepID=A0A6A4H856_9AGAR|nr:hypothetical protein BT96DRAFT_978532 [Gymnopus androsaceus JB14]
MLPPELLCSIVEYLAYVPEICHCERPETHFRTVSPDLVHVSLVNRHCRRICLPFIFAHVRIKSYNMRKLRDCCISNPAIAYSIKMLKASYCDKDGPEAFCELLPHLGRLACVDMRGNALNVAINHAMHQHPTISRILVGQLISMPPEFAPSDMSRVVAKCSEIYAPTLTERNEPVEKLVRYLAQGMKVARLDIHLPERLEENFGRQTFPGVQGFHLYLGYGLVLTSWLPGITATHPQLRKIQFFDQGYYFRRHHSFPFLSPVLDEVSQGYSSAFFPKSVTLNRPSPLGVVWLVTGLNLIVSSSLIDTLLLVSKHFPHIDTLALDLAEQTKYNVDDLIVALARFPSLRILHLTEIFSQLRCVKEKKERPWKPMRPLDKPDRAQKHAAAVESRIQWYASRIAEVSRLWRLSTS